MDDHLRPLSTRELLGRIFSLYRHHGKLFVVVSIIGTAATVIFRLFDLARTVAATHSDLKSATISMVFQIAIGIAIMMLAGLPLSSAAATRAVAAVSVGREIRASEAYSAFSGRAWRIAGIVASIFIRAFLAAVLFILLGMVALALAATLGYNSRVEAGTIGFVCGSIAFSAALVAASAIYVRHAVAIQACVEEDVSWKLALTRSAFLTQGDRVRVASLYTLFILLSFILSFALEIPTLLLRYHPVAFQLSGTLASFIAFALTAPVWTVGISLLYFDERVRKEAFTRQTTIESLGSPPVQPASKL